MSEQFQNSSLEHDTTRFEDGVDLGLHESTLRSVEEGRALAAAAEAAMKAAQAEKQHHVTGPEQIAIYGLHLQRLREDAQVSQGEYELVG